MLDFLDGRDIIYTTIGLALLGLTLQPGLARYRLFNLPFFYLLVGAAFGLAGFPLVSPLIGEMSARIVEHASELIVIISLAGAGLAIDTPMTWRNWLPTWRLLLIAMPLTILAITALGAGVLGLGIASALLLAAALAPTDPVLARAVQVTPPGQDETPIQVALTAEAGLNDGLAFPFVYIAIHAATLGVATAWGGDGWIWSWIGYDLLYRVAAGVAVGWGVGWLLTKVITSPIGDASHGAWNSIVVVLAATFLAYGITEAANGYGFLACFFAARAGRAATRGTEHEGYERFVHHGADQVEAVLLAILLLWLGAFLGSGLLFDLTLLEIGFALALVLVVRPLAGLLALVGVACDRRARLTTAFFGIRGMGSVFYIAYAQTHADFADLEAVWRIAGVTILVSIVIHGFAANFFIEDGEEEMHPDRRGRL